MTQLADPAPATTGSATTGSATTGSATTESATTESLPGRLVSRFVRRQAGGLPRAFWALWTGTLVNRIGYLVEPFLAYYLTGHLGLSVTAAGVVLAANGLGGIFSQLIAGAATDRFGRRATLTLGMLANGASLIGLGYARGIATIFAVTFVFGVTVDMYRPASDALVADLVSPAERPRAYGLIFWAVNLGFSLAMVLGGTLARAGFLWLFWADAATCVLFGVIVWRLVPDTRPVPGPQARAKTAGSQLGAVKTDRAGFGVVFRDAVMVGYLGLTLAYTFVYLQAYTTLPLAMKLHGLSPSDYGLAMAVNGLLIVVLQPLLNGWLARRDHVAALAAGMAVVGLGFGLTALAGSTLWYAVTVIVWTLGEILTAGMAGTIVAALAPVHLRGRYSGLIGAAWGAGYLLAPLGGTRLLVLGESVLWLTCCGLCTAASAGLLALGPAIRRRSAGVVLPSQQDICDGGGETR
jgi:MFS family permease